MTTTPHRHPRLFTRSYCALVAANFLLYFGFWILIPLLPFYLRESYGLQEGIIGLILSCYTVSALMVRPFSGYLLDTFARKPLYLLAYGIFTVIFCGYIVGGALTAFVTLRIIHGLAFGTVTVGGNTLVIDIMPSERRGEGLGYYGLANNIAMSTGPMTGLFLHHGHLSYPAIFAIAMSACTLGFLLACTVKGRPHRGDGAPQKATVRQPISLDRFILVKGLRASLALLLISIPYGATTNYVAMYVEQMSLDVTTGCYFVLLAAGMGVSRLFAGRYVDRGYITQCIHYGFYLVVLAFLLLSSCARLMTWNPTAVQVLFYIIPFIQGIGFGIMFPAYNSLYVNLGRHDQRATATSTYLTAWDVGIGIGIVSSGIIAEHSSFANVYFIGSLLSLTAMVYFNLVVTPHYHAHKLR